MLEALPTTLKAVTQSNPSDNVAATAATVTRMAKIVKANKASPEVIQTARRVIAHIPNKDWIGEAKAIQDFVRNTIRYTRDVHGVETLQTPEVTLREKHGDCDDHAILVAALLASTGHPARLRAIKVKGKPHFCHVFAETRIANRWYPVETTEPWSFGEVSPVVDMKGSIIRYV